MYIYVIVSICFCLISVSPIITITVTMAIVIWRCNRVKFARTFGSKRVELVKRFGNASWKKRTIVLSLMVFVDWYTSLLLLCHTFLVPHRTGHSRTSCMNRLTLWRLVANNHYRCVLFEERVFSLFWFRGRRSFITCDFRSISYIPSWLKERLVAAHCIPFESEKP